MPRMHPVLIRMALRESERAIRRKARAHNTAPAEVPGDYDEERRKVDLAIEAALANITNKRDSGES